MIEHDPMKAEETARARSAQLRSPGNRVLWNKSYNPYFADRPVEVTIVKWHKSGRWLIVQDDQGKEHRIRPWNVTEIEKEN